MIHLKVVQDGSPGRTVLLEEGRPLVVGRSSSCDVTIRDPALSRRHLKLLVHGRRIGLQDLASSNGTLVNGRRVRAASLKPGDRIRLGATEIVVVDGDLAAAVSTRELSARTVAKLLKDMPACESCGALVPATEVKSGKARASANSVFCSGCTDPYLGMLLGGFRILALLGAGAVGTVYRARQESLDRIVALKVLQKWVTADPSGVQRFLREAKTGSLLDHPGIVQTIDTGFEQGVYYLAMEYVDGGTLADRLKRDGRLRLGEALSLGEKVAAALAHAHERGVVHRDVKPGNILLAKGGEPKVTDLGMAKILEESGLTTLTRTGTTMGTLTYMPPEQLLDARQADARSDVYSLGATVFHLIAGTRPYPGTTPREYAEQIQKFPVHWPPKSSGVEAPPAVRAVIEKAMAKDPAARYARMADFGGELARLRDAVR
ncbi:MAG: serine/threonine-protein kinase [Planctomycetales bacterium]|nr:serine/threonine-protein kinase [Planctomycetales bacterium]